MFETTDETLINHIQSDEKNGDTENLSQHAHIHLFEETGTGQSTEKHTDHDGTSDAGLSTRVNIIKTLKWSINI